jgi:hypothetical protein
MKEWNFEPLSGLFRRRTLLFSGEQMPTIFETIRRTPNHLVGNPLPIVSHCRMQPTELFVFIIGEWMMN